MDPRRASPVPLQQSAGGLRAIQVTEMEPWLSETEQKSMPQAALGVVTSPVRVSGSLGFGDENLSPRQLFVPRFERCPVSIPVSRALTI